MNLGDLITRLQTHFSPEERGLLDGADYPGRTEAAIAAINAAMQFLFSNHAPWARRGTHGFILHALAVALLITAAGLLLKDRLQGWGRQFRITDASRFKHLQPLLTWVAGVVMGVLVTLTSIGAGALGTVMLVYLYPFRMNSNKLVGTDLAHAIPLALVAGLGHLSLGHVNFPLLGNLLVGSIPGVLVGSFISARAPLKVLRYAIATVLGAVAVKLLLA